MRCLLGLLTLSLVALAHPQDVVGKWLGAYKVDSSKMSASERQAAESMAKSTKLVLTLRSDKTFMVEIAGPTQKSKTEGTYRIEKGKLITTDTKRNGKPVLDHHKRLTTFTIASGGKELHTKIESSKLPAVLVFKRG